MHPHIWYPFTQAKTALEPPKVKSAKGVWLELDNGHKIMDCISSWWVNTYGHCHPKIAEAIYQQSQQLEQVIFAGFTHDPAEQLAEKLIAKLSNSLNRVFFSDNGSTAVEVGLKMAYQYWVNQGQERSTFLAFEGAYHGDTVGAMSVGARSLFSAVFSNLLFNVEFVPFPATYWGDCTVEETEARVISILETVLNKSGNRIAGIIIEPLVQGAGGMRMCRPQFLQKLRAIAHSLNTLLIFDEVMTGFGRTGDWFACHRAGVSPDILCLSKGITGGFLPFAVTVCSESIYTAFYDDEPLKTLYHGHSYTANPLGCAAALAGLELMAEYEPQFRGMEAKHYECLARFKNHPNVEKPRVTGTIAAMDLVTQEPSGYLNTVALDIRRRAIAKGLLLRPLGNVLYILPPYCISDAELAQIYQGIEDILTDLSSHSLI